MSFYTGFQFLSPWAEISPWEIKFDHFLDQCKCDEKIFCIWGRGTGKNGLKSAPEAFARLEPCYIIFTLHYIMHDYFTLTCSLVSSHTSFIRNQPATPPPYPQHYNILHLNPAIFSQTFQIPTQPLALSLPISKNTTHKKPNFTWQNTVTNTLLIHHLATPSPTFPSQ